MCLRLGMTSGEGPVALESQWDHSGVIVGSRFECWDRSGLQWDRSGNTVGSHIVIAVVEVGSQLDFKCQFSI